MNKKLIDWWTGGASYSSEYQAILDRATALGYTHPSSAQKTKQDTLVRALKTAGIWTELDVLYVFMTDGSRSFSKLNWISPSANELTEVNGGSITFTSNVGFSTANTASYLTSGNISWYSGNWQQNDASFFCYLSSLVSSTSSTALGAGNLNNVMSYMPQYAADGRRRFTINVGTDAQITRALNTSSFRHVKRIDSGNIYEYENGASALSVASTSAAGLTPSALIVLNRSASGNNLSGTMGLVGVGASLNGLESSLYTCFNTYITSL